MKARRISRARLAVVCLSLVAVIAAMALLSQAGTIVPDTAPAITGEAASYPVTADGYTHGSNIGRTASGTPVTTADEFITALNNNQDINLRNNIELSDTQAFSHTGTYSATIYGNGYKIAYSGRHSNNSADSVSSDASRGGLISQLGSTGQIYDLNVEFSSGQAAFAVTSGGGNVNVGGIVGYLNGGTIENCTISYSGSGMRIAAATWSSEYGNWPNEKTSWPVVGGVAGKVAGGSTIKDVTVKSNNTSNYIVAGVAASGSSTSSLSIDNSIGTAGALAGYLDGGNTTVDNIIIEGNATVKGFYGSMLGMAASTGTEIATKNFYNKLNATFTTANSGNASGYVKYENKGSVSVENMYKSSSAYDSNGTYAGTITNRVTVGSDYSIYFDPEATSIDSSLVVVKSGITGGENYTATIADVKATPDVYTDNYAFSSDGGTVIFRDLPLRTGGTAAEILRVR